jgi:osmoprotectant transport system permease protein
VNLDYLIENRSHVYDLGVEHLQLTAIALAIAMVFAIPLGVLITSVRPLSLPVLVILGLIYTIPSLAFLAFLIPWFGLGRQPAVIVLATYAQLALVRNISTALQGVDATLLEAARGVGMNAVQVFWRVRLPLALPVLIAGFRIALVTTISLATVTAWINAGGLGSLLFDGIARNYNSEILAGAIAITFLALCADAILRVIERMTPAARAARVPIASEAS